MRQKTITSASVSLLFVLTAFFFMPTYLYFTNALEFTTSFLDLALIFLALSLACGVLLTALLSVLKPAPHERAVSMLLMVSMLLWIQGNVLVWQYGPLDGREIDWGSNWYYGLIDGAAWIVLLIVAFMAARQISKIARRAVVAYILIQIVSTLVVANAAPDTADLRKKTVEDEEAIFRFSPEKNVVILVLDQFQTDTFQEIINESLYYRDIVDGATYYRNAISAYPRTAASITSIFTGRYYENKVPLQDFIKQAALENSLPKIFKEEGYQVDLIGGRQFLYADESIASNRFLLNRLDMQHAEIKEAAFLLDLALFRDLPHFLKKYVYNNQSWLISNFRFTKVFAPRERQANSIRLMQKMSRTASADNNRYTFKYLHLHFPHLPVRFNERLEYVEFLPATRANYKEQAKGALNLVYLFVTRLKHIGVYDNTFLFVIGDHGAGGNVEIGPSGYTEDSRIKTQKLDDMFKGGALPLVLVKPFGARGPLQISDAPVSLADIAKTILSSLDMNDSNMPGVSFYDLKESEPRERRYMHYDWNLETKKLYAPYLPPLEEYSVTGFSWLDESWRPTGRVFTSEGVESFDPSAHR